MSVEYPLSTRQLIDKWQTLFLLDSKKLFLQYRKLESRNFCQINSTELFLRWMVELFSGWLIINSTHYPIEF